MSAPTTGPEPGDVAPERATGASAVATTADMMSASTILNSSPTMDKG
jgi:hypothetical protein